MDEEELEELEEQVRELKEKKERQEKAAELRKRKRHLEMQDTWYGQILLGLKIYVEKTPKVVGKVLDWLIPPPEPRPEREKPPEPDIQDPAEREDRGESGDEGLSMEQELYQAMGGTIEQD